MKQYIKIVILIIIFVLILGIINFVNVSTKPKFVDYDMDATDSKHYNLIDVIKIENVSFSILDYEYIETEKNPQVILNLNINDNSYQLLHDKYTFGLAYNDKYLLKSNCSYNNNELRIVDFSGNKVTQFNQFVIIDNETLKITATINLENE